MLKQNVQFSLTIPLPVGIQHELAFEFFLGESYKIVLNQPTPILNCFPHKAFLNYGARLSLYLLLYETTLVRVMFLQKSTSGNGEIQD